MIDFPFKISKTIRSLK